MKPIRLTKHAYEQCAERGATEEQVHYAIRFGARKTAKRDRQQCACNFSFGQIWQGSFYAIQQVVPIIKEEEHEIVVITVYTFYF